MARPLIIKITDPNGTTTIFPSLNAATKALNRAPSYFAPRLTGTAGMNNEGYLWQIMPPDTVIPTNQPQIKPMEKPVAKNINKKILVTDPKGNKKLYQSYRQGSIAMGYNSLYLANKIHKKQFHNDQGFSWQIL